MTDQQVWDALGYSGNREIKTPNLDRLASEGAYFEQAITPCAVCVPARTAILTGRLLETTEIRNNRDASKSIDFPSFDQLLVKDGYTSEYHGKYHAPKNLANIYSNPEQNGTSREQQIFDWERLYVNDIKQNTKKRQLKEGELYENTFYGGTIPYILSPLDRKYDYLPSGKIPEEEIKQRKYGQGDVHGVLDLPLDKTITAVQGRFALDALDRIKDKPFILTCSFHCPHVPITPAAKYVAMYNKDKISVPESIHDSKSNSPYKAQRFQEKYADEKLIKDMVVNYYAFVTEIDDWVGKILTKLDDLNLSENTLVIFVSDHGEMLGAHGMRGKFNFYEESVRVPFIFRLPGKIEAGQRFDVPVSTMNIFPTVLDYAGINSISSDGYSMRGMMEKGEAPKYEFAVSEWDWKNASAPSIMIKTKAWKLMTTHRSGGADVDVLFDLEKDPYEMNNLLGINPERQKHSKTVEKLRGKLLGYLEDVDSPIIEGIAAREIIKK
ncbi:MAG: sulfatase-like hydrolase/transferase [Cyclobacteriaceae bacterium]|nr:sulfatase-like hydrolase/transferase [Cyclobacteriaceae bacterium]